jgi:hypothetical protein
MNVVKFEFPILDYREPLFLATSAPCKDNIVEIHHEDTGKIVRYYVQNVIYSFRQIGDSLFGSGDHTVCVKLSGF